MERDSRLLGAKCSSPPNLDLETSNMFQNRSLQVPAPNLGLETFKMLQNQALEVQVAIGSKSSPGDLQNASKSTPGGTSGHQLQI